MKNVLIYFLVVFLCSFSSKRDPWTNLLDTKLSQWESYLSFKHQEGYNGEEPKDSVGNIIAPIGRNLDKFGVFTTIEEQGDIVLKVSGEYYGCLFTKREYANYHLKMKVKWGEKKWPPREDLLKDSGILYHSIGPLGAEHWRTWMLSQEFQIMEGHIGDYWNQATSAIDVKAYIPEYIMNPVADASQPFISLGEQEEIQGFCLRSGNYEKPSGDWNTIELICFEGKSLHIVNGEIVMVLKNSRYIKSGASLPLTKGKIQLQSEAAEVYYKDIKIRQLESLPKKYARLF